METSQNKRSVAKKAGVALIWFFIIVLLLTYLSRAVSKSLKATVETGYLSTGMLDRSLEGTGKWVVGGTQLYTTYFTRRIIAIYVQPGQTVTEGDPLFSYDVSTVTGGKTVSKKNVVAAEEAVAKAEAALENAEDPAYAQKVLESAKQALEYAKFTFAQYYALQNGGVVRASFSGTLVKCDLSVGKSSTAGSTGFEVAPDGVFFTLNLSEKEAERIAVGDRVILLGDGEKTGDTLTIERIDAPDAEGIVPVVCSGDSKEQHLNGEAQDWRIEKQSQKYQALVPIAALRQSGPDQYYVLVLTEKETILGTEQIVEERSVKLLEHDDTRAAIDAGVLSDNDRLVTVSSKELRSGDVVVEKDA